MNSEMSWNSGSHPQKHKSSESWITSRRIHSPSNFIRSLEVSDPDDSHGQLRWEPIKTKAGGGIHPNSWRQQVRRDQDSSLQTPWSRAFPQERWQGDSQPLELTPEEFYTHRECSDTALIRCLGACKTLSSLKYFVTQVAWWPLQKEFTVFAAFWTPAKNAGPRSSSHCLPYPPLTPRGQNVCWLLSTGLPTWCCPIRKHQKCQHLYKNVCHRW